MRKVYCDRCRKEIISEGYYTNAIRTYFYDKEGCKREVTREYCKKCYKKMRKEILEKIEA